MKQNDRAPRRGLRANRGSAIITVLVAVALVSILGTVLLYMTYTGYKMKATERQSKENFYDAEAAVNEIRTGIQLAVSTSISTANTQALENYSAPVGGSVSIDFKDYFADAMLHYRPETAKDNLLAGTLDPSAGYAYYNCDALLSFISSHASNVTINNGDATGVVAVDLDQATGTVTAITLKNIAVHYVNNGYETNITTDIRVTVPDFSYEESNLVLTSIQDYVIIADTSLTQGIAGYQNLTLDGNIYAGNVNLSIAGCSLTIGGSDAYTVIVHDDINVSRGALTVGSASTLWANRIAVGINGDLTLSGKTYVADDLALEGNGAAATLSGRYYGFGSSDTVAGASSSILINGHNTDLNLGSLDILMLAGQCFIGTGDVSTGLSGIGNNDLLTGESVSVKSNQIAYLIPPDCFTASSGLSTNPVIYPTTGTPSRSVLLDFVDTSKALWDGGPSLDINDYHASVEVVYRSLGSQTLVYFYIGFPSPEDAGNYFKDYFEHNASMIDTYMSLYTSLSITDDPEDLLTADDAVYSGPGSFSSLADSLSERFENLRSTLSPMDDSGGDVYSHLVNEDAINSDLPVDGRTLFFDVDGTVVGVISRKANDSLSSIAQYVSDQGLDQDLKVIVTTGDITVDQEFNGLIVSGGTVNMERSIYLDRENVSSALRATTSAGDKTMLDYLKIGSGSSGTTTDSVTWDLESLVTYQNWSKH